MSLPTNLRILAGSASLPLAQALARELGVELCEADLPDPKSGERRYTPGRFPDGEIRVQIQQSVRGKDVFVIQSTCPPVNDHLMELLLLVDALKRASARMVCAVIPYFGYARQDRKKTGRVPISARLVANLLETAGVDRVVTLELHAGQIQGFFNVPVDHLRIDPLLHRHILAHHPEWVEELVVASPDLGGVWRARRLGKLFDCPLAVVVTYRSERGEKARLPTGEIRQQVIGDVRGKRVLLVDDILATGGTLVEAAQALVDAGAREVYAACAHGLFVGEALSALERAPLRQVLVTDSIALRDEVRRHPKVEVVSIVRFLADAIRRIYQHESITEFLAYGP
ncbi:MAG: ribose-phosphate pyrophosphokinase [Candidatus Bipolaricaulaceae bacterium]